MLTRVHIRGYRTFRDLAIDRLSRVNLFVGNNNAGKTSLLEALFLLADAGRPLLTNRGNILRSPAGLRFSPGITGKGLQSLCKQLFADGDTNRTVSIEGCHTALARMELTVKAISPANNIETTAPGTAESMRLQFRYRDRLRAQRPHEGCLHMGSGREHIEGESMFPMLPAAVLLPADTEPGHDREAVRRLTELDTRVRRTELLPALQAVKPDLKFVTVRHVAGRSEIWCDVGLAEPRPLFAMGRSVTSLARLVLAMAEAKGGIILVDEIANGFHHANLHLMWRTAIKAARRHDVQLFATTHSWECIHAAHRAVRKSDAPDEELHLCRLEVDPQGNNRSVAYEPETLDFCLDQNIEVR